MSSDMFEVRRDDGELCGFVAADGGRWQSLTVFGATLATHDTRAEAEQHVEHTGLSVMADRWTLVDPSTGEEELVSIQQVSPVEVTLALGYYSLPGVPTVTITVDELRSGRRRLEHRS